MDIETLRDFCLSQKGVTEGFPFDAHTLAFKVMGKIFALVSLERRPLQCNLKCEPERALILREKYDGTIIPGYHMSKKHWNTLLLEQLPSDLIKTLILDSYQLVVAGLPKRLKEQLSEM